MTMRVGTIQQKQATVQPNANVGNSEGTNYGHMQNDQYQIFFLTTSIATAAGITYMVTTPAPPGRHLDQTTTTTAHARIQ